MNKVGYLYCGCWCPGAKHQGISIHNTDTKPAILNWYHKKLILLIVLIENIHRMKNGPVIQMLISCFHCTTRSDMIHHNNKACYSGGHYSDYYPGALSFKSSHCSSYEDWAPVGIWRRPIFRCLIFEWVNSSPLSAMYMRQWIRSALVQIMACRLFGAKPLSKPMLGYCQLDP